MRKHLWIGLLVIGALIASTLACDLGGRRTVAGQPTVQLLSPPAGSQVAVGRQLYLQARAYARGGIARIDFAVNGAGIGSRSPTRSQRIFTTAQPWTVPATAGTYTLAATAYDADGQASAPAQVTITVREPGSFVPPGGGAPPSGGAPGGPEPTVEFRADRTSLPAGECTTLRWDAEYVQEVYLDGAGVSGHGTRDVCPGETTTYVLLVVLPGGESQDYAVTIEVTGSTEPATGPDLAVLAVDCPGGQSDESIPFQAQVQNLGDQAAQSAQWRWSVNNAGAGPSKWAQGGTFNLEPGATTLLQGSIPARAAGQWTVYVEVRVDGETVTGNNQGSANFSVAGAGAGNPPAAPTNLRATSWGATYIRLAWDDHANNEDGFQVFQQGRQDPVAQTGPNQTQAQIDNPPCGQTLQFRVRAFNAAGNSDYSNTISVQTAPCAQGGGPDLAVATVWCSRTQSAGQPVPFRVEVRNVGGANAQGATWSWTVVQRGQAPGANWLVGGTFNVPAGGSTVLEGTAQGLSQGNWTFLVNVSLAGEVNTGNNQGSYDFSVAAAQGGGGGQAMAVTSVTASVSPEIFSGPCPHTINFSGVIAANGAGTVTYRWERSNGEVGQTRSVTFDAAGTKTVTSPNWALNQSGTYWAKLHVLTPNDMISLQAKFTLNCGPSFKVTLASVSVNPTAFTGACPKTMTFNGTIKTDGPGTVKYRWVRNGEEGSTKSVTFNAAGTQTVTGDWTMDKSGTYKMSLHILEPNDLRSNEAQFKLTCSGGPPPKPTNLRVIARGKTSIKLAWNDNSDDEDAFTIEISPPPYTGWAIIESVGSNTVQCTITGLTCGTTWRFRVRAHNDDGFSEYSNEAEGATLSCN